MSIKSFGINYQELKVREWIYLAFLLVIISIGILLLLFKTTIYYEYKGKMNDDLIEINNLESKDLDVILNSLKITIDSQEIKYEVIEIKENNFLYYAILKVNTNKISVTSDVILKCIYEEIKLYEFIFETIKGGIING